MIIATSNGDARAAAANYLGMGFIPVPIPRVGRCKAPILEGWQDLRPSPDDLEDLFPPGQALNVGLLLGAPSGGLVDIDLDAGEAVAAGPLLLPPTGWVSGHKNKPKSHWWYRVETPPDKAQDKYSDLDGSDLLELRSTRGQTIAPPGVHESGEKIVWYTSDRPADVTLTDLRQAVGEVAAAALLARHWPAKGTRQDTFLALVGALLRAEWSQERVERFVEAVAVATHDDEARKRVQVAALTADKLEQERKATGWPTLGKLLGENGKAVTRRVREWLGMLTAVQAVEEPPVPEPPPWPEPPAEEAFHGLAGKIVRTIEPASEADRCALLVQALVSFGSVIGRSAYFSVEADRHYCNEFIVLVGPTSKARKGTSWGQILRLFRQADELWATDRIQTGASSGEGLIWAIRDPIYKRERVKQNGVVQYEDVESDAGIDDKRLLVYEPEFANVLKQTERQGNTLSAILRQAWDGGHLRTMTKNSPARATGAHVSLIGHITSDELRRYLTQTETANGYGNRHLWICAKRSKLLPEGGCVDPEAWDGIRNELVAALAFARTAGEITRDEEARALWCEIYEPLSEGKPGLAGALLARAEAHVMRLAMIYALLDRSPLIQAQHLLAAVALWDYVERSVYFVFGDDLGDPVADDLLRLLRSCPKGLTRNELRDYFSRHHSSDRIGRALGLLLQHRLARFERKETGGRPAERWFAVGRGQGQ